MQKLVVALLGIALTSTHAFGMKELAQALVESIIIKQTEAQNNKNNEEFEILRQNAKSVMALSLNEQKLLLAKFIPEKETAISPLKLEDMHNLSGVLLTVAYDKLARLKESQFKRIENKTVESEAALKQCMQELQSGGIIDDICNALDMYKQ